MFDRLVDTPKKRSLLILIIALFLLFFSCCIDFIFALSTLNATGFAELINIIGIHLESFYGYFFYSALTASFTYVPNIFGLIFTFFALVIESLSVYQWFLLVILLCLILSHRSKHAKITMCLLILYFTLLLLTTSGIAMYLVSAANSNDATLLLQRIQHSSIFLLFFQSSFIVMSVSYFYTLFKKEYLKLMN